MSAPPSNRKAAAAPGNIRRPSAQTTPTAASAAKDSATASSRSPSRLAPQASATASGGGGAAATGVNRTRSVRNGAPVSARAAARGKAQAEGDTAMEDMKAEMQAKLDELQEKLQAAELACADAQKHASVLQHKLDDAHTEQGSLEEQVHEHTERVEELENAKKESVRARRELEQIYEAERAQTMKEREETQAKEEEMQATLQRLKETLAQREMRAGLEDGGGGGRPTTSRSSSFRSNGASPNPDAGQFAPPSSVHRSDSRSNSKLVNQKDKIIEGLRLELAEAQIKLVEVENQGGGRMSDLQRQMYEVKVQNARLMEENESFQLLLTERTLHGDFPNSELLRVPTNVEGSRPPSRQPNVGGASLADELRDQDDVDASFITDGGASTVTDEQAKRLQSEVNSLKDQNKALTLYINNIVSRLLQHEQFEQILDKTPDLMSGGPSNGSQKAPANTAKDLPPPPPPKDDEVQPAGERPQPEADDKPTSLLQRAKSVMVGGGKSRPRPVTSAISSSDQDKLQHQLRVATADDPKPTENPDTAPRIPLGRSSSTRGGGPAGTASGHRRANSEWTPATVVTNMYKGPAPPSWQGPASPGLTSPTGVRGSSFFAGARGLNDGASVPRIQEGGKEKENAGPDRSQEQRESKVLNPAFSQTQSQRSSVISNWNPDVDSETGGSGPGNSLSTPSSPPRSTTSSAAERGREDRQAGAVMVGSKPRPLRLVQEAAEDDAAAAAAKRKAGNRGSWFGWMGKGGTAPGKSEAEGGRP
ncbi:hypothetical protein B0A50_02601 [Salinomyces thailandicus]|uniref:M protein, serotype 2.1 n=1 Tax=Salinomyces thailandicus TaxID=706561 RepID=A0A4U0U5Y8_9PEZI|nr:hypothetical protein B0A50_02601 [Salinomyces thailandica]